MGQQHIFKNTFGKKKYIKHFQASDILILIISFGLESRNSRAFPLFSMALIQCFQEYFSNLFSWIGQI